MRRLALAALIFYGCNTPSVPIPPPLLTDLQFQAAPTAGEVVLSSQPDARQASARVYIYNNTKAEGVIVTAATDGSYTSAPFAGVTGDVVAVYYETPAGDLSGEICTQLQIGVSLISQSCP